VSQWGKGEIIDTAFASDGSFFAIASNFGTAIYDMHDLVSPPAWVPFPGYISYDAIDISLDGKQLLLTGVSIGEGKEWHKEQLIYDLETGAISEDNGEVDWYQPAVRNPDWREDTISVSPDRHYQLKTGIRSTLPGNPPDVMREMTNPQDGSLYYELADHLTTVHYGENQPPYGCDADFFIPGAEAGEPVMPMQVEWSTDSNSFAILYKAPSYTRPTIVRIYNAADGQLIGDLGEPVPVVDFAYVPGEETMLVSYVDGHIELWDVRSARSGWEAHDFNSNIRFMTYSSTGMYLLVSTEFSYTRSGLEVRNVDDGTLQTMFAPAPFAASPVEDTVALGQQNGDIEIRELAGGDLIRTLKGHQMEVYALAYSGDGRYLASSSLDCTIRLWDSQTGQYLHSFEETETTGYVPGLYSRLFAWQLNFIPGTNDLIGLGTWGTVVKWDVTTGARRFSFISDMIFEKGSMIDDQYPAPFSVDVEKNIIYLDKESYNYQTGEDMGPFSPPSSFPENCSMFGPKSLGGSLQFTKGLEANIGNICVIRVSDNSLVTLIPLSPDRLSVSYYPTGIRLSPDGTQLTAFMLSGTIFVYQITIPTRGE
jgi:WD40 repeat protein